MDECVVLFCCVEKIDEKNPDRVIESAHQDILVCTFDDPIRIFLIDFFDTTEEDNAFIHPVLTNGNRFCQFCLLCGMEPVSYTHLRAHETDSYLVCRLLL